MSQRECSDCSRVSNNKHFNCPPNMADGRHFTDYRPRCMANFVFPENESLNSYEYRQYLIHNADTLIKENQIRAYKANMCGPCVEPFDIGTMLPEQNMVSCDASTCKTFLSDQNGLGTGRMYNTVPKNTTPRNEFLRGKQNEQTYMRQFTNCCTSDEDNLQYYPWDGQVTEEQVGRLSVPGGGIPMSGGNRPM